MGNQDIFKKIIWDKTNGKCWYCGKELIMRTGKTGIGLHTGNNLFVIEHMDGLIRDSIENLVPACNGCNAQKGSRTVEEFRIKMSKDFLIIFYGETL